MPIPAAADRTPDGAPVAAQGAGKRWHATIAASNGDAGWREGGQLVFQTAFDAPLHLRDTLTLSAVAGGQVDRGMGLARAAAAHYRLSLGDWRLAFGARRSQLRRALAIGQARLDWRWHGTDMQAEIGHEVMRGDQSLTMRAGLFRRQAAGSIDGVDLDVQRLRTAGWTVGLQHRHAGRQLAATLDASWMADLPGGHGSRHDPWAMPQACRAAPVVRLRAALGALASGMPALQRPFRVDTALLLQRTMTHGAAQPSSHFSIGDRQTVRGFGGRHVLAAENGWAVSNELTIPAWQGAVQWVAGADVGHVWGPAAAALPGRTLAGAGVGVRGRWPRAGAAALHLELSLGWPLRMPRAFAGHRGSLWLQLASTF